MGCQARRYSDQLNCAACGLVWDINDPEPPKCKPAARRRSSYNELAARVVAQMPPGVTATITAQMPLSLPVDVAAQMARAYRASLDYGEVAAMRAAYRVFLDNLP